MQCERDKLRNDLMVANERASLLAQEVDDNHARMEHSVQQKLKYVLEILTCAQEGIQRIQNRLCLKNMA